MITKKTKYAFKALIRLASIPSAEPVLIADLARTEKIPKKFLESILLSLRKGGILQSRIGKGGGYSLALPPNRISLAAIIRLLEGDIAPVQCLSTTNYVKCEECADERTCGIRLSMVDVDSALTEVLERLTVADMVSRSQNERRKLQNLIDYVI
jgi:Rrf2 family protein